MHVWIDGELLADPEEAAIKVTDHGFTVGDGVFEAVKVVEGRPFALEAHLDRLERSASGLGLQAPTPDVVRRGVAAVLGEEHQTLGRLRITLTAGPAPLGSGRGNHAPTLVVVAVPMEATPETTSIVTVPWPRNEHSAIAGLKTTSYAENVVALAHAREHGASEAIFANTAGHLCEGTGTNLFYVVDGELRTPTLASGCLAGVTRALVLDWCEAREVDELIAVAEEADEVFVVSTTRDVQAVTRWGSRELSVGPVTQQAATTWARRESELLLPV